MQFIAIDWSGNAASAAQFTALACVRDGSLNEVRVGRTGSELANHVRDLAAQDAQTVVGLDFAFSLPAWYLRERGFASVEELWQAALVEGERWLKGEGPFWGRPGVKRPNLEEHFRLTDKAVPGVGGISPKSVFQVGGAGAVGTGSVRGWPFLSGLRERGFHIWPFEDGWPRVIEIYPRVLTKEVVKSNAAARRRYLEKLPWRLSPEMMSMAAASSDTFDAAVSALVMAQHSEELRALKATTDEQTRLEGAIWFPSSAPVEPLLTSAEPTVGPSDRFSDALAFAARTHGHQMRKGSNVPYIGHLLGVASIVIEEGGDEDQAIAALLHDAVEDQGGLPMLDSIRQRFGDRVAEIVWACTDAHAERKPEWGPRKKAYLDRLPHEPPDALLVSLADKLYNARAILADYRLLGPAVWERFNAGGPSQVDYYEQLAKIFEGLGGKVPARLVEDFVQVVSEIGRLHKQDLAAR